MSVFVCAAKLQRMRRRCVSVLSAWLWGLDMLCWLPAVCCRVPCVAAAPAAQHMAPVKAMRSCVQRLCFVCEVTGWGLAHGQHSTFSGLVLLQRVCKCLAPAAVSEPSLPMLCEHHAAAGSLVHIELAVATMHSE